MPKIKIFVVHGGYNSYDEREDYICGSLSDWCEVTQDELDQIRSREGQALLTKQFLKNKDSSYIHIVEEVTDQVDIPVIIKDISEFLKKEKVASKKREAEEKKKRDQLKEKRELKKLEKARQLLESKGML